MPTSRTAGALVVVVVLAGAMVVSDTVVFLT